GRRLRRVWRRLRRWRLRWIRRPGRWRRGRRFGGESARRGAGGGPGAACLHVPDSRGIGACLRRGVGVVAQRALGQGAARGARALIARLRLAPTRPARVMCDADGWSFDPRYTQGGAARSAAGPRKERPTRRGGWPW